MQRSHNAPGRTTAPARAGHPSSRGDQTEPSVLGALAVAAVVAVLLGLMGTPLWALGLIFGGVVCVVIIAAGGSTRR